MIRVNGTVTDHDHIRFGAFQHTYLCHFSGAVSFFGDGYIHLRTVEKSIQTVIHVRFRTSSQMGLLFLAAGNKDFLLLELISGRLQVRLDLGSGERSLRSARGLHLSDLEWHTVQLNHTQNNIVLTVDQHSPSNLRMPGPDLELNIEEGVLVGGTAGLNQSYLGISNGFRGCMDKVVFNDRDLLSNLQLYSGYKSTHEVLMGCSSQFSATEEDPIGFSSSKAFISLPPWEVLQEGVFECDLHPSAKAESGVVLYSSGYEGGFVAIEIRDGHLVISVGNGKGSKTELHSLTNVHSNHTWYPIQLYLLPHSIQLKIDKELVKASLSQELKVIPLKGPLFLGGLNEKAMVEANGSGMSSVASGGASFTGCLKNIKVNNKRTGLPQATISKDVNVGCKQNQEPISVTSKPTSPPELDLTTQTDSKKRRPNFLWLRKLELAEGGRAPLEPKHMKVNLDFRKLGIHPSQLKFRIEELPVHGEEKDQTFTMLDLWQGRVTYTHDGSEERNDSFTFSVFASNDKEVPGFLKGKELYRFDISISPVNDAPILSLLVLLHQRYPLLIKHKAHFLVFHYNRKFSETWNCTVQKLIFSFRPINLFSLGDLEEGKISYVHTGVLASRLALRVSDGHKVSNTVVLRVMAVALEHKLVNNTGIELNQGEACIITNRHLAVQVNVADNTVDIWYDVVELPEYGEIQRLHSNGDWKSTTSFSQRLLDKERIRYLSTYNGLQAQSNITDHFKCKIVINSQAKGDVVFPIVINWIHLKVTRSKMEVNGLQTAVLTPEDLHVVSKGTKFSESELYFRLLTLPKKGQLFFNGKPLQRSSTFSQKNVTDGLVKYALFNRLHDDTRDTFGFQVFSAHAASMMHDFRINIKAESSAVTVVNKGFSTLEGASKVIPKDLLFTHVANNREVHYTITTTPRHGQLRKINLSNSTSINDNIVTFTNQDIIQERIMYVHDDSETKQDSFTFQVVVHKPHKHTNKEDRHTTEHTFNISIQLVNDQKPVRVVDKVFHVARDGQRLVTLEDLRYHDDDTDFDDSWLVYTRRGIPMGELVLASDPNHKLYEFTQRDLEQKKVLFIHSGVSFGRFVLFVTDGKHYVSALLEVMAQDPYLQVENNTGLMLQRGGITALTSANLSVSSNLDIRDPQEVTFEVFIPPKRGVLCFNDGQKETIIGTDAISVFTQRDLMAGRLAYHHGGSLELSDGFEVTARVHLDIGVAIKIYLESHHRPPTVKRNHLVVVAEKQNVSINKEHLEVVHEDSRPAEIVFTIQSPPKLGVLRRLPPKDKLKIGKEDRHHLHKVQSMFIQFQGNRRTLEIDIIPLLLPLQVKIEHHPLLFYAEGINVAQFTSRLRQKMLESLFICFQVEQEYIAYVHDGSETLTDNFTVVANQTETRKHSPPCTVHINVTPVNDETPVVTTNRGLKVWMNSVTDITVKDLSAEDSDTPPEGLEFVVTPPSNGYLALKTAPSRHILNFTQSHIQSRQLLFVHSGALLGGFHFQVNDGVNFAHRQIFSTTAYSLVLTLQRNHRMTVYPGSVTPISKQELQVVTNNISDIRRNQSIVFAVTAPPKLGRLVQRMPDNSTRGIHTFTQSMVGTCLYPLFSSQVSASSPIRDFFSFKIFCPTGAVVAEGGRVTIDRSKLDASNLLGKVPVTHQKDHHVMYRVISLPRHGILSIRGNQPDFSQVTLNKFGITYVHDDSETTSDSFTFRAWVAPLDYSSLSSSSSSLSAFSSDSSSTSSFSSLYSSSSRDPASRQHGLKENVDHDTPPEELHYFVISKPNNGYLTLGERPEPVTSFTQYDVNHGRLHFIQQVISIYFLKFKNVCVGATQLKQFFLNLVVKPSVSMVNNTGLSLVQGRTAVILTTNQLAAQTNGQRQANISYTVTKHPRHGRIAINDQEVTTFRHEDLQFGRVVYHMTDLSESEDSFQILVSASSPGVDYENVPNQTVNVTVRPLIYLREPVKVPSGIAVKLGKAMIDASELARISRANPVFEVLSPPKHGKLVKVKVFVSPTSIMKVAIEETLSDDENQFPSNGSMLTITQRRAPATPLNDSFVFLVKAGNVQPAKGELHFTIFPHHQMRHGPGGFTKVDGRSHKHTTANGQRHNKTSTRVGEERTGQEAIDEVSRPHILTDKVQNKTQRTRKPQNRHGKRTHTHGGRSGGVAEGAGDGQGTPPLPHAPPVPEIHRPVNPPDSELIHVEILPRPSSDPLLIILPLLACLLLIVILVVLILVFRHRKEKQARQRLMHELAAVHLPTEDSPYLGRPERSVAMPSVMVTPLGSASCPTSPRVSMSPRRSLAPGMTFWGPFESEFAGVDRNIKGCNRRERHTVTCGRAVPLSVAGFQTSARSQSPTLKENQYWV
uniref:Laminin G domain-containing protein n=1 Tax=Oryzias latipes TaxID=8090 RepID=H2M7L3_ORYLA